MWKAKIQDVVRNTQNIPNNANITSFIGGFHAEVSGNCVLVFQEDEADRARDFARECAEHASLGALQKVAAYLLHFLKEKKIVLKAPMLGLVVCPRRRESRPRHGVCAVAFAATFAKSM